MKSIQEIIAGSRNAGLVPCETWGIFYSNVRSAYGTQQVSLSTRTDIQGPA